MNKKNIVTIISYIFIVVIVVVAFFRLKPEIEKPAETEIYSMNTVIDMSIYGPDKEKALKKCVEKIQEINKLVDDFSKESDVYKINENAGIKPVKVSKITLDMTAKSIEIAKQTNGAFDPAVYPLSKLWGFKNGDFKIPKKEEISNTLKLVSYKDIKIDLSKSTIFLIKKDEGIDLGGIAKGYTLDSIKEILSSYKIDRALINMGGNILTYKNPPNGKYWRIGIRNPRGDGVIRIINVSGTTFISTSGDYERFFIENGTRYCHIINPYTGYPADQIASVTVVSNVGYLGDALSTAFFVKGKDYAIKNAEKFNVGIIGFDKELNQFVSNNYKKFFYLEK